MNAGARCQWSAGRHALGQDGVARIAESRRDHGQLCQHGARAAQSQNVRGKQNHDARKAREEAAQAPHRDGFSRDEEGREAQRGQRHHGHQDPRHRRWHRLRTPGDEAEGKDIACNRQHREDPPQWTKTLACPKRRQGPAEGIKRRRQRRRRHDKADHHHSERGQCAHAHFDQQKCRPEQDHQHGHHHPPIVGETGGRHGSVRGGVGHGKSSLSVRKRMSMSSSVV